MNKYRAVTQSRVSVDPYADFAERYDLSFGTFAEIDINAVNFFQQLFTMNNAHQILDCACGTGRHLPLFYKLGCHVTGSDVSESMLAKAGENLKNLGLDIPLFIADFRHLQESFSQPFDAIVCLGAIGFMTNEQELSVAFRSMYDLLNPGGLLILTAIPTDRQWKEKPRFMLIANSPSFSRIFAIDYFEQKARFNILDIFHSKDNSEMKVWSANLTVFLKDQQEALLMNCGFKSVNFYGEFDFSPYSKEYSNNMITVAQK
jgi:cyclopropane fatty-acyl-phospholipid synthase-like methyltransferase